MARATSRSIDWGTISSYLREVRRASRTPVEPLAKESMPSVDARRVRSFRARATHLDKRSAAGSLVKAARGGLQDSAPRDALLALHARVDGVTPDSWHHPTLVQIWFRWADYVVPRADVDVFTLGAMPRETKFAEALTELAEAIVDELDGDEAAPQAVASALNGIPNPLLIRAANVTGRFHILWDARTVKILRAPLPTTDPEDARLEIARRFLRWLGPASARRFAYWAGVTRRNAEETWSALGEELIPVAVEGQERALLAADLPALLEAEPVRGVRFIPQGDPYRAPDKLVAQTEPKLHRPGIDRRLLNSLAAGRVIFDGELVASWGRRQNHLTIAPWGTLSKRALDSIAAEGEALAGPIGQPMHLRWLD